MPDTEEPQPPKEEALEAGRPTQPTEISDEEYHEHSEQFMDALNEKAEALQEGREDVEMEYSVSHRSSLSATINANDRLTLRT